MKIRKPLLVFEDISPGSRHRLFTFAGVEVMATSRAWMSPLSFCLLGFTIAIAGHQGETLASELLHGIAFGVMLSVCNLVHSLGHILSGKLTRGLMDILLLTATRDVTLYTSDQSRHSKWTFIGRSLGGPVFNVIIALAGFGLWKVTGTGWVLMFAGFNLAIGIWTLVPIPSMDGWVIWGELFGFRHRS